MAITKTKGDLGVAMVMSDAMRRGYKIAIPFGEDWPFDLVVLRKGRLERVQCKYTESDGQKVSVRCRSANNWISYKYTASDVDWVAVYDKTTNKCYYVPSSLLGGGKAELYLRLTEPKNGQKKGIRMARDYMSF